MATRSEQYRATEERRAAAKKPRKQSKASVPRGTQSRAKAHAARKATYALEESAPGKRPSRKSTRKSANHAKADATLNQMEELRGAAPEVRFRKAQARAGRVRGSK